MAGSSLQHGRILIVRPSALGDVCRTVPVLASLRRAFPHAAIDWVVRDTFIGAVSAHPALNEVIPFPRSRFSNWWRSGAVAAEMRAWFRALKRRRYDLVLDLQGLSRSGLITRATDAPRRVGWRSAREAAWVAYTIRHQGPTQTHIVDQMLELVDREGIEPVRDLTLHAPPDSISWWRDERSRRSISGLPYAVLAPTSGWLSKRWPIERWTALLAPLKSRGFERIVIVGAPGERTQIESLLAADRAARRESPLVDLLGSVDVGGLMAVVRDASLVVAHDSGPLHMAVGFDRPCVALFGPTDPAFVGPYRAPHSVVRCYDPRQHGPVNFRDRDLDDGLMRLISVDDVLNRIDAVLALDAGTAQPLRAGR